jgi:hypothetical protein
MTPMCMSVIGSNAGSEPTAHCSPSGFNGSAAVPVGSRVGLVHALRLDERLHEIRHGIGEDPLLVGHRSGVVDHHEHIDLVDRRLRHLVV